MTYPTLHHRPSPVGLLCDSGGRSLPCRAGSKKQKSQKLANPSTQSHGREPAPSFSWAGLQVKRTRQERQDGAQVRDRDTGTPQLPQPAAQQRAIADDTTTSGGGLHRSGALPPWELASDTASSDTASAPATLLTPSKVDMLTEEMADVTEQELHRRINTLSNVLSVLTGVGQARLLQCPASLIAALWEIVDELPARMVRTSHCLRPSSRLAHRTAGCLRCASRMPAWQHTSCSRMACVHMHRPTCRVLADGVYCRAARRREQAPCVLSALLECS